MCVGRAQAVPAIYRELSKPLNSKLNSKPRQFMFDLFYLFAAAGARSDAVPRNSERGDRAEVPEVQGDQVGQYPRRGHRRRKPQAHPRPHLDHHPPLPGRRLVPQFSYLCRELVWTNTASVVSSPKYFGHLFFGLNIFLWTHVKYFSISRGAGRNSGQAP